ncbi:Zinc finger (C3HC4-type RING finger) family protein [Thalictrum thalictroides]|uniref:Zinc finger (C3HC4-type RING finger) family protein n=1 Tax=Thalictrum thalictroides TaxID=46969 RepID=A0A7J6X322_THATH|nr:Zinc finger (C3HC4-type RING finger) family protein [Thalictrum thalictroides]
MVGASKLRRAARKIRLPCGSFSSRQVNDDPIIIYSNISNSITSVKPLKDDPEATTTSTKSLCAICLEPLSYKTGLSPGQAIFTAQCSHAFHFSCISSNVRHGSVTCPICRAYWTQLPRDLNPPPINPCNQTDPILRILDDSIATFRVHRRSSLRSARYDDDDPIEPDHTHNQNRLQFTLVPVPLTQPSFPPCVHPSYYPYGLSALQHFTSSSSLTPRNESLNGQKQYVCTNGAYLSVKLAQQQATDLVLVASPNGPHLRLLKQSMALVVFSLRSIDRLAIVTYSSTATRAFPLRRMTCHGKRTALQVIDRLFYMGDSDPGPGLKKGIKILEDRAHQNPQSSILHLSDNPTRSYEIPAPIHQFHVGYGYGTSSGFVMHEFEEFLARLLGGVIRDTHLRIGEDGEVIKLGELRGGEERRIPLYLNDSEFVSVNYSYMECGGDECLRTGEIEVSLDDKGLRDCGGEAGERDVSIVGRTSSVESWDYHDPYMARRWAKHLHGYRL